ncbi:hypothetical protein [Pseudomonas koreensis]|uniref:Uncharacterized protein n=1 Tax=Pseudomonas koreensis TaxID=198620 RepID=A0A9X2XFE7_9PSED|nr:hypothetical protein [Pseudomonas koreensis]MCU7247960.1 hypothetical protein [Pseudomonas koreensis]
MVERAGIQLPLMYRLGYDNANCIGCVKGGEGYFRAIREDFPEQFEVLCQVQNELGPSSYFIGTVRPISAFLYVISRLVSTAETRHYRPALSFAKWLRPTIN